MTPAEPDRWRSRPVLGALVRILVVLVPLAVSVAVSLLVMDALPAPRGVLGHVAWWSLVLVVSWTTALLVDRLARRALPLAVLLELSLVFPDRAPTRLRTLRSATTRELESQLMTLRTAGVRGSQLQVAETLVTLVGVLGLHDPKTRGHSERVRAYVDLISDELELPEEDRLRLRWAALIHDLGKLTVPAAVLNGGKDLPEDAWVQLHAHPDEGDRLAAGLLPWLGEWGSSVREHHEWWNGRGYPQGLAGEDISRGGRIIGVADAFEVMTANRSYSRARSASAARAELAACAGTQFDPAVVRAFLQISLGKLRWVLGPLTWLSIAPFGANRIGDVLRAGAATAAVVGSVATGLAPGTTAAQLDDRRRDAAAGASPSAEPAGGGPAPTTGSPPTSPGSSPAASLGPSPGASPTGSVVADPSAARPVRTTAPPGSSAVGSGVRRYFLEPGRLTTARPDGEPPSTVRLTAGGPGRSFARDVGSQAITLSEAPDLLVYAKVLTASGRDGVGLLRVTLADCASSAGPCRTISTDTLPIGVEPDANRDGYSAETGKLSESPHALAAGHVLRMTLSLETQGNASSAVLAFGSSSARSRLQIMLGPG